MKRYSIYLYYNVAYQGSAYVRTDDKLLRENGQGDRESRPKSPKKEYDMDDSFDINLLSKPSAIKEQIFFFKELQ